MVKENRVLILNRDYVPIRLASSRNAVCRLYTGAVEAVTVSDDGVRQYDWDEWLVHGTGDVKFRSERVVVYVPSIVRFVKYDGVPTTTLRPTRKSVLERDGYTCYLCGRRLPEKNLTIDHVVPPV